VTARGPAADPLAAGDGLAAALLAELEPLRFAEAAGAGECEDAFRLRRRAVVERGMVPDRPLVDGLERDEFDAGAVQILGWDGDRPVATCRLVLPAAGRALPVVTAFGLSVPDPARVVEWGRVVVDPGYRGDGHSVLMGLMARGWLSMRARGLTTVVAATSGRLVELFRTLGFAVTVLGPPRAHWGEERVPILCEAAAAVPHLARQWGTRGEGPWRRSTA
jgi:N-acyl-L-homoserine lactone synthetase